MTLKFQPGEIEKKVTLTIIDDKKIERDESFFLYLSAGEDVHLTPFHEAEVIIMNDDGKLARTHAEFVFADAQ